MPFWVRYHVDRALSGNTMSRVLAPIGGAGGGGVDPVSQSNLVRYAKGQPTLIQTVRGVGFLLKPGAPKAVAP